MLSLFRRKQSESGLICTRCEKSLEGHDEAACARRMSRRFFFGMLGGAAAAAARPGISGYAINLRKLNAAMDLAGLTISIEMGPTFITPLQITNDALWALRNELDHVLYVNCEYERSMQRFTSGKYAEEFENKAPRIGDAINVRRPRPFVSA